jgi:hypothetical protein
MGNEIFFENPIRLGEKNPRILVESLLELGDIAVP